MVDCRRHHPFAQRKQGGRGFHRASRADAMAMHRLGRGNQDRLGLFAQDHVDRRRFGAVIDRRRGAVGIDVVDLAGRHSGV